MNSASVGSFDLSQPENLLWSDFVILLKAISGGAYFLLMCYSTAFFTGYTDIGWVIGRTAMAPLLVLDSFLFIAPTFITLSAYILL